MIKQSGLLQSRKRALQTQLLQLTGPMIQGSLVKLRQSRCGKMNCHCHRRGDPGHGYFHYLSVAARKKTEMHYLPKDLIPQMPSRLRAFKQFWKIGKMISKINLALLKEPARRRKNHARSR